MYIQPTYARTIRCGAAMALLLYLLHSGLAADGQPAATARSQIAPSATAPSDTDPSNTDPSNIDPTTGPGLTLAEAVEHALERNPEITAALAAVEEAKGRRLAARAYPYNPEIEVSAADRTRPDGSSTDRSFAVSQELEIGGQAGHRQSAATAAVAAAEERLEHRRRQVVAAVSRAFAEAVRDRELLVVARADVELTRNLLQLEERRLEAGAGTRIEVNLARAAAGRAAHHLQRSEAAWWVSRSRLAEVTGLAPETPPAPRGELPTAPEEDDDGNPSLETLTRRALVARHDLAARRRDVQWSRRRSRLERSLAVPNLRFTGFVDREEAAEISGAGLAVSIPLFNRHQGAVAEAEAASDRASAVLAAAELSVRAEVAAAHGRWRSARRALRTLDDLVVRSLEESLALLRRAVDAGELSATDVLLLRRELVDGRREAIAAAAEMWLAGIDLELAVGSAPTEQRGEDDPTRETERETKEASDEIH